MHLSNMTGIKFSTQNEIIKCERSGHVLYVEDHLSVANMTMESLCSQF